MEYFDGKMVKFIKEDGSKEWNMEKEFGQEFLEIAIKGIGIWTNNKDTVYINIKKVFIKDILKTSSKMEKENKHLLMEINMKENIVKENRMEMENISGLMAIHIKDSF